MNNHYNHPVDFQIRTMLVVLERLLRLSGSRFTIIRGTHCTVLMDVFPGAAVKQLPK
jgi:hypothetical protein